MEASFDGAKLREVRKDRGKTQAMLAVKWALLFAMYEPWRPVRRQTHPHVFSVK